MKVTGAGGACGLAATGRCEFGVWGVGVPHVLLVDDHPELLVTVAEALRALGFTVTEAMSRAQATAILAGRRFDIVVTDSVLRGGNGDDVTKSARRAGVPVIVISGDPECVKRYAIGDLPFLAKPFYPTQLAELINRVIAAKPPSP